MCTAYKIEGGVLQEDGPTHSSYAPGAHPNIATEIAKLHEGDEGAVLAFAERWGCLGWSDLVQVGTTGDDPMMGQAIVATHGWEIGADPLPWVWAHARGVRVCLDLIPYIGDDADDSALTHYLAAHGSQLATDAGFAPERVLFLQFGAGLEVITEGFSTLGDLATNTRAVARDIVTRIINSNLAHMRPQLYQVDGDGHLDLRHTFTALIDVVYWHLAQFIVGAMRLGRCEECGASFPLTDQRRRFCPPEGWAVESAKARGTRPESKCAKRARMRRLRRGDTSKSQREGS